MLRRAPTDAATPPGELDDASSASAPEWQKKTRPTPRACGAARRARWRARTSTGWRRARVGMPARRAQRTERDGRDRASRRRARRRDRGRPCPLVPDGAAGTAHERERALGIRRKEGGLAAPEHPVAHALTSVPPRPIETRSDPADSALAHASSLGSIPPLALAGGADARASESAPRSHRARPERRSGTRAPPPRARRQAPPLRRRR